MNYINSMLKNKKKQNPVDQTEFANQSPIYERGQDELLQQAETRIQSPGFFQTNKGKLIIAFGAFFFLVIIALVWLSLNQPQSQPEQQIIETAPGQEQQLSPLEQKIRNLQLQLRQADPTEKETPFPQVEAEIEVN